MKILTIILCTLLAVACKDNEDSFSGVENEDLSAYVGKQILCITPDARGREMVITFTDSTRMVVIGYRWKLRITK